MVQGSSVKPATTPGVRSIRNVSAFIISKHSSRDLWSQQGWPEVQATPAFSLP